MDKSNEHIFCPFPWVSYSIRSDGKARVCCFSHLGPEKGILYDDNGEIIRYNDDFNEGRNCQKLKDIRLSFLRNEWHQECIRCQEDHENEGFQSRHITRTNRFKNYLDYETAKKVTRSDGSINTKEIPLRHFDIRAGNVCNLKCRMCRSGHSNQWYSEDHNIFKKTKIEGEHKFISDEGKVVIENDPYSWHENDDFWNILKDHLEDIRVIYIVGGEPLLIKKNQEFLEICVALDAAKNIDIEYNTNLMYLPEETLEIWKNFKSVSVLASIDGLGKVNEYIRYPSNFEIINRNLRRIDDMPDNIILGLFCTIMVYNILYLPDFLEWVIQQNFKKLNVSKMFKNYPLHTPLFLNQQIFPEKSKKIIENLFEERIDKVKTMNFDEQTTQKYIEWLRGHIIHMNKVDRSDLIDDFFDFTQKLDDSRNQNIDDYLPGLRELLSIRETI